MRNMSGLLTGAVFSGGRTDAEELSSTRDELRQGPPVQDRRAIDRAVADHTRRIRNNPDDAAAYHSRGVAYARKEDYRQAIRDFTQAIRLNPHYAVAYNNRGNAYDENGDKDRAIAEYAQEIRRPTGYADAYFNRGLVYDKQEEYPKARADYEKVLEIDPDSYLAQHNLAVLRKEGHWESDA